MQAFLPLYALVGLCVGSFLNMLIMRLPDPARSLFRPLYSACPTCDARVRPYDNIPVFSWLFLRGRCRSCKAPISVMYPLVEAAAGLVAVWVVYRYGVSLEALLWGTFLLALIGCAMSDLRTLLLPDLFTWHTGAFGVLLFGMIGGWAYAGERLVHGLVAALCLYLVGWTATKALKKEALGFGDVLLVGMLGVFLSFGGALLAIYAGAVSGVIAHFAQRKDSGRLIPFGTHLALGAMLVYSLKVLGIGEPLLLYAEMLNGLIPW
jgi:leader peptidase (prepilin peptidase) / N-methyltransferase